VLEYIHFLLDDERGSAWVLNALMGVEDDNCCRECISTTFAAAALTFTAAPVSFRTSAQAYQHLCSTMATIRPSPTNERRSTELEALLTHVCTIKDMLDYHFDLSSELAKAPYYLQETGISNQEKAELALLALSNQTHLKIRPGATLGRSRTWLASMPNRELEQLRQLRNKEVTDAAFERDVRGLIHIDENEYLVQYRLGNDTRFVVFRPRATDGVGERYIARGQASKASDAHGYSLDLFSFAKLDQRNTTDGTLEYITDRIDLEKVRPNQIVNLGRVAHYRVSNVVDLRSRSSTRTFEPGAAKRGKSPFDDHAAFVQMLFKRYGKQGDLLPMLKAEIEKILDL
jgi:hypothetical protein